MPGPKLESATSPVASSAYGPLDPSSTVALDKIHEQLQLIDKSTSVLHHAAKFNPHMMMLSTLSSPSGSCIKNKFVLRRLYYEVTVKKISNSASVQPCS
jgi:hypothetical protein